jgi:ElaB/YqjD/DUF883 family membrane-anchored ribosome-binding protein
MSNTTDQLGKQAQEVTENLQTMGRTVRDAAREKIGQAGEKAAEYSGQARDQLHGVACACEQSIRARPLRSILMAAGIGWLLGRFWKRG